MKIHVVKENRFYASTSELPGASSSLDYGIIKAKRALNDLHYELGASGYSQVYVDQMTPDVVAVTRHCPVTHQSIVLVAHTAFRHPDDNSANQGYIKPLVLDGRVEEVILEAHLVHKNFQSVFHQSRNKTYGQTVIFDNFKSLDLSVSSQGGGGGGPRYVAPNHHQGHATRINGCGDEYQCHMRQRISLDASHMLKRVDDHPSAGKTVLHFHDFLPGSVVVIRVKLSTDAQSAIVRLRSLLTGLALPVKPMSLPVRSQSTTSMPSMSASSVPNRDQLERILNNMTLADLNVALYRCNEEEVEDGRPGTYVVPGSGPFIYCGLQGVMSFLSDIRPANDLGHPLCANLREGDWLAAYITNRLQQYEGTAEFGRWLDAALNPLIDLPRYLVPCYFDAVITGAYLALLGRAWSLMSRYE